MIKEVIMFETNDGKRFDKIEAAENHIVYEICAFIELRIEFENNKRKNKLTRNEIFSIIDMLFGDIEKCKQIYSLLHSMLRDKNEDI